MREWQYWTRNKLSILAGYLPAFNVASSKRSPERLYIDLMAGEPFNRDKETGEEFDILCGCEPTSSIMSSFQFTLAAPLPSPCVLRQTSSQRLET